ncbi:MAG: NAD-dependent epimerase/dehydratase family protein [Thermoplasmatales archaeon]|nr:NAD-dependent epimerase/dehydratase family protein [Thermoplasmatales archaeon]
MRAIVTGGAGFIGGHLVDALLSEGWDVTAVDSVPRENVTKLPLDSPRLTYVQRDISKGGVGIKESVDWVFHLAAHADNRSAGDGPGTNYRCTLGTTQSVLEYMRASGTRNLFFSSTAAVYGHRPGVRLREDEGGLRPVSYYGACKLASEALISAHVHMDGINALIFRFPNVVGPGMTHGVVHDFVAKLRKNPKVLEILGDGKQSKQYLHVSDLVRGIMGFVGMAPTGHNVYNVSTETRIDVDSIADIVVGAMGLKDVRYEHTGGSVGWPGDVPTFEYDISKAKAMGWTFEHDSAQAIRKAVEEILSLP